LIQPFQQPERVLGFVNAYRKGKRVTKKLLSGIADQFQDFVHSRSKEWGALIPEPPEGCDDDSRRNKFLETFVDRGQLRKLAQPPVLANGKRISGLKLDQPRQLAVMHALVRFANIAAGGTFTTSDLYAPALEALGFNASQYSLASLRYDLSKLRAKGPGRKDPPDHGDTDSWAKAIRSALSSSNCSKRLTLR
jgi:hypothetical protein